MYNPYFKGKNVYLRHPIEDDVNGKWHEWLSDEDITKYLTDRYWPNCIEAQREFYKTILSSRDRLVLSIVTKTDDQHIGIVSLSGINWVHKYCDISILIGENRGSIYGVESFGLMLKVAFLRLNMENIKSFYAVSNKQSEALHRIYKFTRIGHFDDMLNIDGKPEAMIAELLQKKTWLKRNVGGV